jgi:hypothetical protein
MTANTRKAAAVGAAGAVLALVLVVGHQLDRRDAAASGSPASTTDAAVSAQPSQAGKAQPRGTHKLGDKPYWRSLTPAQQLALQPLQGEWDGMDTVRKQRWLQLASRFGAMKPDEQQRMHERMRAWIKLTPEQRELARETYSRTRKITPDQKTASWESYLQLPDEQKRQLAASAATRKAPAVVPSQANAKVVTPLGQGAAACPAGTVRNGVSATPPCVAAPAPGTSGAPAVPAPAAPPSTTPATPAPPAQPEKQVPANWGITPNNA